ncbi:MAG: DUF2058 domain-containing protein [Pseudomonadota bacterium]
MANSLQDQLRKSGLVSSQKAKQSRAEKRKKSKQSRSGVADEEAARRDALAKEQAAKVERDRELNLQRKAEAEAKSIAAQVRQIAEINAVDRGDGASSYNYTQNGKIRTAHVSEAVRNALVAGQLAIVAADAETEIVPAGAARKIADRMPEAVLLLNESAAGSGTVDEDDPYADFQVPDDLMW